MEENFQLLGKSSYAQNILLLEQLGAITLTETLRPLKHCASLSYYDVTSAQYLS